MIYSFNKHALYNTVYIRSHSQVLKQHVKLTVREICSRREWRPLVGAVLSVMCAVWVVRCVQGGRRPRGRSAGVRW